MNMKRNEPSRIDKDSLDFLYAMCFRNYSDGFEAAGNRAYLDFNRTIRFNERFAGETGKELRKDLRTKAIDLIKDNINELKARENVNQKEFDEWHSNLSEEIKKVYKGSTDQSDNTLTVGQTQKWINMTLKYLHVWDNCFLGDIFQYCHIPLDNYILDISMKEFGIEKSTDAWSKWDDKQYQKYQEGLREKIKEKEGISPLRWEFQAWIDAIDRHENNVVTPKKCGGQRDSDKTGKY